MWQFDEKRLVALRESHGMTQSEFARKLGLNNRQQIRQWESLYRKQIPSTRTLLKIANVFDVVPAYFFVKVNDFEI